MERTSRRAIQGEGVAEATAGELALSLLDIHHMWLETREGGEIDVREGLCGHREPDIKDPVLTLPKEGSGFALESWELMI